MLLWIVGGIVVAEVLLLTVVVAGRVFSDWRYSRITKIWLEVPPDIPSQMVMPLLTRLSQRYQGTTTLVVFPEGCREVEGKRLTLGWGFKPCGALLAVLRELGTVTLGT